MGVNIPAGCYNHWKLKGRARSEDIRRKISEAKKGVIFSEKHRKNISKAQIGKKLSEEHRKNISESHKGHRLSEETKRKISEKAKGRSLSKETRNKLSLIKKNRIVTNKTRKKMSEAQKGDKSHFYGKRGKLSPVWKGGEKITNAKRNTKRRKQGFVLITNKNPYTEPVEFHHISSELPYVIPCPARIHHIFNGKSHVENVNAMLGLKFVLGSLI